MSVVPAAAGRATLICDVCGGDVEVPDHDLRDDDVVWPLLDAEGWAGSALATGPHQCPRCAATPLLGTPLLATPLPGTPLRGPAGPRTGSGSSNARERPPVRELTPVRVRQMPDVTVLGIDGDLDTAVAGRLRAVLASAIDAGRDVVLDLAGTGAIDPVGLGLLVRAQREARKAGLVVMLVAPSSVILTVLHTMHLIRVFPMFRDVPAALGRRPSTDRTRGPSADAEAGTVDQQSGPTWRIG
ncbi:STAS domain-containing protein [Micromonospora sp. WMMD1102]|uniref:STAS domain-containing protein n=1 Tax=Micromonospora sp. WMMD1102 TaxID=3016105 RepID=UPI00241558CE|nr:STAS domain-containing protein [Micromonospora sp. WMMD1102]MDG4787828.1 STAS domain-containing protein [Micromonospora sp. WMMD1102]